MDLCLIAALAWTDINLWIAVLMVAAGLGFVIFVHELGHFAVAKMCGVKCEKFYIGFDVPLGRFVIWLMNCVPFGSFVSRLISREGEFSLFGLKIPKTIGKPIRWGETEYGIGIIPLGGYVKMLGQEDNPARLREEIERAKQQADAEAAGDGDQPTDAETPEPTDAPACESIDVAAAEAALYDPRSYLAQNVPKRMAIISAGVIMNLIFAWVMASVAFSPGMGVTRNECVVGHLLPGQAAWQKDIRVGDRLLQVGDRETRKFRDMQEAIMLGDNLEDGVPIKLDRCGAEPLTVIVEPDSSGMLPMIGISSPSTMTLHEEGPSVPGSPADTASSKFMPGDTIVKIGVKIDGKPVEEPVENIADLHRLLAMHADKRLTITVRRNTQKKAAKGSDATQPTDSTSTHRIDVALNPMRRLGLVMEIGNISAVQEDSAAASAEPQSSPETKKGIKPGDRIVKIRGTSGDEIRLGDPMTLAERLRGHVGEQIIVTVARGKKKIDFAVKVDPTDSFEIPSYYMPNGPVTVPALGIAYHVLNKVKSSDVPGSVFARARKAATAKGKKAAIPGPRDVLVSAKLIPPENQTPDEKEAEQQEVTVSFDEENRNWPRLIYMLQECLQHTKVELTWKNEDGEHHTETFKPTSAADWFYPRRGFRFENMTFIEKGSTIGEAIRLGGDETLHSTLMVYRFLQKLAARQVSPKALGGPVSIFRVAKHYAEKGTSDLLIFLTLLSANLAVINFLPIPMLDGGHMVLLAWEGIRGKPASEQVQGVLAYVGLAFLLSLMIWVIGLDIWRLVSG